MRTLKDSIRELVDKARSELNVNSSDADNLNVLLQFLDDVAQEVE